MLFASSLARSPLNSSRVFVVVVVVTVTVITVPSFDLICLSNLSLTPLVLHRPMAEGKFDLPDDLLPSKPSDHPWTPKGINLNLFDSIESESMRGFRLLI